MFTLLSSLSSYGYKGAPFEEVELWIKSGLFSRQTASKAYENNYISSRHVATLNDDIFSPSNGKLDICITKYGLAKLREYKKTANYGREAWNPNEKVKEFMNKMSKNRNKE